MKTALLFLHGMNGGDHQAVCRYSFQVYDTLCKTLPEDVISRLQFHPLVYQDFLEPEQQRTIALYKDSKLGLSGIRSFFVNHLGDALGYEYAGSEEGSAKETIQQYLCTRLQEISNEIGADGNIIIWAESLGAHVIVDYFKDFGCPDTIRLLITQGCNIPLFMSVRKNFKLFKPGNENFEWYNYYYKNDVLGWPLQPLEKNNSGFRDLVTEDVCLGRGWWFLSHQHYNNSRHCKKLSKLLVPIVRR